MTAATRENNDLAGSIGSVRGQPRRANPHTFPDDSVCQERASNPSELSLAGVTDRTAVIAEQWIDDLASGLRIGIQVFDDSSSVSFRIILMKAEDEVLTFGDREILFSADGKKCGGGTYMRNVCAVKSPTPRAEIGET